jgi:hypothetical protein
MAPYALLIMLATRHTARPQQLNCILSCTLSHGAQQALLVTIMASLCHAWPEVALRGITPSVAPSSLLSSENQHSPALRDTTPPLPLACPWSCTGRTHRLCWPMSASSCQTQHHPCALLTSVGYFHTSTVTQPCPTFITVHGTHLVVRISPPGLKVQFCMRAVGAKLNAAWTMQELWTRACACHFACFSSPRIGWGCI